MPRELSAVRKLSRWRSGFYNLYRCLVLATQGTGVGRSWEHATSPRKPELGKWFFNPDSRSRFVHFNHDTNLEQYRGRLGQVGHIPLYCRRRQLGPRYNPVTFVARLDRLRWTRASCWPVVKSTHLLCTKTTPKRKEHSKHQIPKTKKLLNTNH